VTKQQSNKNHEATASFRHPLSLRSASSIGRSQSNNSGTATLNPNTCQGKVYTLFRSNTKVKRCRLNLIGRKLDTADSRFQATCCAETPGGQASSYSGFASVSSFFRRFLPKIQETTMPTKYSSNMGVEKTSMLAISEVGVRIAATMKIMRIA
jgi:hypothetical protein